MQEPKVFIRSGVTISRGGVFCGVGEVSVVCRRNNDYAVHVCAGIGTCDPSALAGGAHYSVITRNNLVRPRRAIGRTTFDVRTDGGPVLNIMFKESSDDVDFCEFVVAAAWVAERQRSQHPPPPIVLSLSGDVRGDDTLPVLGRGMEVRVSWTVLDVVLRNCGKASKQRVQPVQQPHQQNLSSPVCTTPPPFSKSPPCLRSPVSDQVSFGQSCATGSLKRVLSRGSLDEVWETAASASNGGSTGSCGEFWLKHPNHQLKSGSSWFDDPNASTRYTDIHNSSEAELKSVVLGQTSDLLDTVLLGRRRRRGQFVVAGPADFFDLMPWCSDGAVVTIEVHGESRRFESSLSNRSSSCYPTSIDHLSLPPKSVHQVCEVTSDGTSTSGGGGNLQHTPLLESDDGSDDDTSGAVEWWEGAWECFVGPGAAWVRLPLIPALFGVWCLVTPSYPAFTPAAIKGDAYHLAFVILVAVKAVLLDVRRIRCRRDVARLAGEVWRFRASVLEKVDNNSMATIEKRNSLCKPPSSLQSAPSVPRSPPHRRECGVAFGTVVDIVCGVSFAAALACAAASQAGDDAGLVRRHLAALLVMPTAWWSFTAAALHFRSAAASLTAACDEVAAEPTHPRRVAALWGSARELFADAAATWNGVLTTLVFSLFTSTAWAGFVLFKGFGSSVYAHLVFSGATFLLAAVTLGACTRHLNTVPVSHFLEHYRQWSLVSGTGDIAGSSWDSALAFFSASSSAPLAWQVFGYPVPNYFWSTLAALSILSSVASLILLVLV